MTPKERLTRIIRSVMRGTLYHATFDCSVERQHDDDTLDLLPDDKRVRDRGLTGVPIRHGLPGVRVRVAVGSRVLLGFENGDPRRPYAALWQRGSIEEIAFDGGSSPIARAGDGVRVIWPSISVTGTVPGGTITGTLSIGTVTAGVIEQGNPNFLA